MRGHTYFQRYIRQIDIPEMGVRGQRMLLKSRVLVIGLGGLGCPIVQYLAAAGIGTLGLLDFDRVELHNLNRQILYGEQHLQQHKVWAAFTQLRKINSSTQFIPIPIALGERNIQGILSAFDIVVDATDNFETRYLINDACVLLNIPLVYGSILAFEGQQMVFNYQGSKNLRDLYPQAPPAAAAQTCDSRGVLGPLAGMIGSMMAMEVLKIAAGIPLQKNRLTLIDALTWRFSSLGF